MAESALRMEIEEAKDKIKLGENPRNPFEAVIFREAREEMDKDKGDA